LKFVQDWLLEMVVPRMQRTLSRVFPGLAFNGMVMLPLKLVPAFGEAQTNSDASLKSPSEFQSAQMAKP